MKVPRAVLDTGAAKTVSYVPKYFFERFSADAKRGLADMADIGLEGAFGNASKVNRPVYFSKINGSEISIEIDGHQFTLDGLGMYSVDDAEMLDDGAIKGLHSEDVLPLIGLDFLRRSNQILDCSDGKYILKIFDRRDNIFDNNNDNNDKDNNYNHNHKNKNNNGTNNNTNSSYVEQREQIEGTYEWTKTWYGDTQWKVEESSMASYPLNLRKVALEENNDEGNKNVANNNAANNNVANNNAADNSDGTNYFQFFINMWRLLLNILNFYSNIITEE